MKVTVKFLKSNIQKSLGLIGKKSFSPVYFETRLGIHTFGLKRAIDVFILDDNLKVKIIKRNLSPNKIFFWNPKYKKVIEAPAKNLKVKINEVIKLNLKDNKH